MHTCREGERLRGAPLPQGTLLTTLGPAWGPLLLNRFDETKAKPSDVCGSLSKGRVAPMSTPWAAQVGDKHWPVPLAGAGHAACAACAR